MTNNDERKAFNAKLGKAIDALVALREDLKQRGQADVLAVVEKAIEFIDNAIVMEEA